MSGGQLNRAEAKPFSRNEMKDEKFFRTNDAYLLSTAKDVYGRQLTAVCVKRPVNILICMSATYDPYLYIIPRVDLEIA